ncbi:hypothetical protein BC834DRAFT_1034203 [Gloeopeniophorella convolvens]|nr:hypothetical protein BC834DRAFT_1034203 [Gloeopeniophorella convolvens]
MSIGECNIHYKNIKLVVKTNIQWSICYRIDHKGITIRPCKIRTDWIRLSELSTFSALPQGQQTILRIAARINEVLRRCHQQGVEPSPAVLWHIEDALDTALELGMNNPILWPHPTVWPMSVRRPDFESGDIEQDQEMQSPDISVSSMDYILNQTDSEDGEIEEIPMEEYDTRRCTVRFKIKCNQMEPMNAHTVQSMGSGAGHLLGGPYHFYMP